MASLAAIGVAVALAVLPALVALGPGRGLAGALAVGAGALVVAVGAVKLAALATGAVRFAAGRWLLYARPSVD
ncbi:MAG TPA: hypothetical protein VEN12_00170 [Verrucomicrobiae bacterium]|nr:hypothetical protein [Verrucomicrobiae bacterium]